LISNIGRKYEEREREREREREIIRPTYGSGFKLLNEMEKANQSSIFKSGLSTKDKF